MWNEKRSRLLFTGGVLALSCVGAADAMSVTVTPSAPSPAPVGTMVTFIATTDGAGSTNLWYRFRVRKQGADYRMIRDFGPISTLAWTATPHEGTFEMEVSVRDLQSGDVATGTALFQFQSRATVGHPVISPTANSLIFLYSAPHCAAGGRMRVEFTAPDGTTQHTPYQACGGGLSMNFYLAGLLADTTYTVHHTLDTGSAFELGPTLSFTTGDLPDNLYSDAVVSRGRSNLSNQILLGSTLAGSAVANDLAGNVLWYGPTDISILTRVVAGGDMWGIIEVAAGDTSQQVLRKFDLTGMTLLETNAARVNEQLAAMGRRQITGFHHEARPLADGRVAALAGVEQILTDVQGPGPVDVLGDMIVVLDQDLNVVWTWDTFDHFDPARAAVLGETCPGACPPLQLSPTANDWTHGNSIQETADGSLLYSTRHQDWLVKIAYDGSNGDGHIIWRLGKDGDFQIDSADPYPWFSHQHDGNFERADPTRLLVFDDGNTRVAVMQGGNSRGQVLEIDEQNRVAKPVLNADLGVYAAAVGSAQRLRDGDYHFDAGFVQEDNTTDSYSFEIDASGQIVYESHQNVVLYRTFRMTDMYTPN